MKYLKLFENRKLESIIEEIRSLSYIMEDEGCPLNFRYFSKEPANWFLMRRCCTKGAFIEISLGSFIDERLDNDFFQEWKDRTKEICDEYGFKFVEQYRNHVYQIY